MAGAVLDMHTLLWYLFESRLLSPDARAAIERADQDADPLFVPSISLVEVQYLVERGRIPSVAQARLHAALAGAVPTLVLIPLDRAVADSVGQVSRVEVPEMPDRVIAATAPRLGVPLLTRDLKLRASSVPTIW